MNLPRKKPIRRFTPMKRVGKMTLKWNRARAELKKGFENAGITRCELQISRCWRDNGLTFAHRVKRRFIRDEVELRMVCLACISCHSIIEAMSHEEMFEAVDSVIRRRNYGCRF